MNFYYDETLNKIKQLEYDASLFLWAYQNLFPDMQFLRHSIDSTRQAEQLKDLNKGLEK